MAANDVTEPAVQALIAAINAGDRQGFFAALTPDATMSDDGTDRDLAGWAEREIPAEQLYDLLFDPNEAHNLVGDPVYAPEHTDLRNRLALIPSPGGSTPRVGRRTLPSRGRRRGVGEPHLRAARRRRPARNPGSDAGGLMLQVYGTELRSRLFLGTSRYPSPAVLSEAVKASRAQVVTVSLRRESSGERAGQAELVSQVDLVLEPRPGGQLPGLDEVLQVLRDLEVERDRAVPVHLEGRGGLSHGDLSAARRG